MIGVDVSVQHLGDPPVVPLSYPRVHIRVHPGVDHRRLALGADDVGEAALPRRRTSITRPRMPAKGTSAAFQARLQALIPPSSDTPDSPALEVAPRRPG